MRRGIHTGIVVAGVVGQRRLLDDLFGDPVNLRSRMESHGQAGRVNLSAYSDDLVRDRFACAYLGKVNVKGKGEISMQSVVRALPRASPPAPAPGEKTPSILTFCFARLSPHHQKSSALIPIHEN